MLGAYEQWSRGKLIDSELKEYLRRFSPLLPTDLRQERDPSAGFAGYTICYVAAIAVEDCGDVVDSLVYTAILYAAGAACQSGHKVISLDLDNLSDCELQFLTKWWEACRVQGLISNAPV